MIRLGIELQSLVTHSKEYKNLENLIKAIPDPLILIMTSYNM